MDMIRRFGILDNAANKSRPQNGNSQPSMRTRIVRVFNQVNQLRISPRLYPIYHATHSSARFGLHLNDCLVVVCLVTVCLVIVCLVFVIVSAQVSFANNVSRDFWQFSKQGLPGIYRPRYVFEHLGLKDRGRYPLVTHGIHQSKSSSHRRNLLFHYIVCCIANSNHNAAS